MNASNWKLGSTTVFWFEKANDYFRRVGFADDILPRSIKHRGWYLEDDGYSGQVARGVVYQLPAHDGKERFLYGVADPYNDGPAVLARDVVDDKADAARWADQLAEAYGESEREYHRASDARCKCEELAGEISELRRMALALLSARRTTHKGNPIIPVGVRRLRAGMRKARKERARLTAAFGDHAGFKDS
jgi:hypothetical protein